jgi:hypothetical protein
MATRSTNPAARLRKLEAALAKAKKIARGKRVSFEPMMELLGVSRPVLRDWCNEIAGFEESGAFVRGGNGIEWEFKPVATVRFLIQHFEAEQQRQIERARKLRRAIGDDALADIPDDMTVDEIIKAVRAAREVREEQESQGALIKASAVRTLFERTFNRMLQAGIQAGREQDPTGQWPPEYAEKWQNAIDNLILKQSAAGEDCLRQMRGGTA